MRIKEGRARRKRGTEGRKDEDRRKKNRKATIGRNKRIMRIKKDGRQERWQDGWMDGRKEGRRMNGW
jgi:hypothetical protein